MFVPLVVSVALLGAALAALRIRSARQQTEAEAAEARLAEIEARTSRALDVLHAAQTGPSETVPPAAEPSERPPRRRTRRPGMTATPDRP